MKMFILVLSFILSSMAFASETELYLCESESAQFRSVTAALVVFNKDSGAFKLDVVNSTGVKRTYWRSGVTTITANTFSGLFQFDEQVIDIFLKDSMNLESTIKTATETHYLNCRMVF